MSRTFLDSLITERALAFMNQGRLHDYVLSSGPADYAPSDVAIPEGATPEDIDVLQELSAIVPIYTKNVCAKVPPRLSDEIDGIVALLGIPKRGFIEAALIDAVNLAKDIMEREGVYEAQAKEEAA